MTNLLLPLTALFVAASAVVWTLAILHALN
jgi:hypothetical protein